MLSLVSVVSDPEKARARLHAGLARQTAQYDLVVVENRDGQFTSAASALNWGAARARGDWIVFLHQDVDLLFPDWLSRTEKHLSQLDPDGWCGVVGRNASGRWCGVLHDRAMIFFGKPTDSPVEVQTLDEVVL